MNPIETLTKRIIEFRDRRDWKQFHNPKDSAISLVLEAGELLEHFQWKDEKAQWAHIETKREDVADELADVLYWVLLLSNDLNIDISEAFVRKLEKNNEKYPVEKAKGRSNKYTDL